LYFVAVLLFVFYLGWNGYFIWNNVIPPSIWYYYTAIPCPTTGGWRAWQAMLDGQIIQSLKWNPFLAAYLGMSIFSVILLWQSYRHRQRLSLPRYASFLWLILLLISLLYQIIFLPNMR